MGSDQYFIAFMKLDDFCGLWGSRGREKGGSERMKGGSEREVEGGRGR